MERTWIFGNPSVLRMLRAMLIGSTIVSAIALVVVGILQHIPWLFPVAAVITIIDVIFIWKIEFLFGITLYDNILTINKRSFQLSDIRSLHIRSMNVTVRTAKGRTYFVVTSASTQFEKNKTMFTEIQNILLESCNAEVTMVYVHERD